MTVDISLAPYNLAIDAARLLFYAFQNDLSLRYYLVAAGVRTVFNTFTSREIQNLVPSTEETYRTWIRRKERRTRDPALKERLQCDVQPLPDGNSSLLWVGNRHKARKVVLYLHGGGYVIPAVTGHFECVWNAYVLSGVESGTEVAVAFLQYSLASSWKAPVQLCQAAFALSEILHAGFSAKDVVVAGDSAGGNLATQLLHHIIDPHTEACRITLSEPLAAACLISPWLSSDMASPSVLAHEGHDMLSRYVMRFLDAENRVSSGNKSSSDADDGWKEPLERKGTWLSGLNGAVGRMHITIGEREILADQGRLMAKTIVALKTGVEVTLDSDPTAGHDFIVVEGVVEEIGEATRRMKRWFKGLL